MTRLRFVGDLPLWFALLLALIVGVMSWRYYSRESFDLPRRLKWFLPLLRSSAFFLGIMVLAGPVLHHRTIIGQLGRVKIYLDASDSMTMRDRHMSTGRKLLIAEQLGWLPPGHVDTALLNVADELADVRRQLVEDLAMAIAGDQKSPDPDQTPGGKKTPEFPDATTIRGIAERMQERLKTLEPRLSATVVARFTSELLQPLAVAVSGTDSNAAGLVTQLKAVAAVCESIESASRRDFEAAITDIVDSGDESVRSALALFDETPRWRRVEMALNESSADVVTKLREQHDVEILLLSGDSAEIRNSWGLEPSQSIASFAGETDLSSGILATQKSIASAIESDAAARQPQTVILLVTDGQHNSGPSPLQTARVLGSQGVRFYGVSVGATQEALDLALLGLESPELVFRQERVRGVMVIRDRMPPGQSFVAQISYDDRVLWQQQLLTQDSSERRIEFEFAIDELVDRLGTQFASDVQHNSLPLAFDVSLSPLPEEFETANNQRTMRLAAIMQSHKVLIIDGRSRWETRYLRNAFERDEQWSVNTIIAGVGTDDTALPR